MLALGETVTVELPWVKYCVVVLMPPALSGLLSVTLVTAVTCLTVVPAAMLVPLTASPSRFRLQLQKTSVYRRRQWPRLASWWSADHIALRQSIEIG